ncbi:enkurin isoform X1 [Centroberyx gerrardi]|uniref:enkurin n=1 Tax=Centroberyx gerrardi TaxID=166262 RepID=UPI003AB0B144
MSEIMYPPESVYNLMPREEVKTEKPPRYMSKFRTTVVLEKKSNKDAMRTMGPAKAEVPSPEKYLRKHSKEPKLPEKKLYSKAGDSVDTLRKPGVPVRTDNPTMGIHTKRDFIKTNALENIMAVPRTQQPTYADTNRGHKQLLEKSGLVPKYIKKKDYGEIPEYLQQRNEEAQRAQEEYDSYVKEQMKQGAMKQLSDEERQNILQGLKKNWEELHHQYQGLSVVTDTITKKSRKERLDLAMKQLESDINVFERFKTIYIANN